MTRVAALNLFGLRQSRWSGLPRDKVKNSIVYMPAHVCGQSRKAGEGRAHALALITHRTALRAGPRPAHPLWKRKLKYVEPLDDPENLKRESNDNERNMEPALAGCHRYQAKREEAGVPDQVFRTKLLDVRGPLDP